MDEPLPKRAKVPGTEPGGGHEAWASTSYVPRHENPLLYCLQTTKAQTSLECFFPRAHHGEEEINYRKTRQKSPNSPYFFFFSRGSMPPYPLVVVGKFLDAQTLGFLKKSGLESCVHWLLSLHRVASRARKGNTSSTIHGIASYSLVIRPHCF